MRTLLRPLILPFLRRDEGEIVRQAERFRIETNAGKALIADLGRAFLGGYNAMLESESPARVAETGMQVPSHYRPFFFEGAAMGYLPRGYFSPGYTTERAERDLVGMNPDFLFLYYVGLGFWFGFRHPKRPETLQTLAEHVDSMYFPLCYDGYGFKLGFFDYRGSGSVDRQLERCPSDLRPFIYQGFGRAMFFVYMDDEKGLGAARESVPREHHADFEIGRSLALGFTGVDRPRALLRHLTAARDADELAARLTGVTWALTAREMNDGEYLARCLGRSGETDTSLLEQLPAFCRAAREEATSYADWQVRTREAVLNFHATLCSR